MAEKVIVASDHAGLVLRTEVVKVARAAGWEVEDLGPFTADRVDYPDFAKAVADAVVARQARLGILVCGTGIGMSMAANKVAGIRAAVCRSEYEARMARAHNDANVLCLGERVTGAGVAGSVVEAFLREDFLGGRHAVRVEQLAALDRR